jgi:hypothetical protein
LNTPVGSPPKNEQIPVLSMTLSLSATSTYTKVCRNKVCLQRRAHASGSSRSS